MSQPPLHRMATAIYHEEHEGQEGLQSLLIPLSVRASAPKTELSSEELLGRERQHVLCCPSQRNAERCHSHQSRKERKEEQLLSTMKNMKIQKEGLTECSTQILLTRGCCGNRNSIGLTLDLLVLSLVSWREIAFDVVYGFLFTTFVSFMVNAVRVLSFKQ